LLNHLCKPFGGNITDIDSQEPLIGAVVQIPELNAGSVTDENGAYKIPNVPVGRYNLRVSYMGYEDQTVSDVIVTSGKEVIANIQMTEKVNEIKEVVVTYDRKEDKTVTNNDMATVSARSFNIEDTKNTQAALVILHEWHQTLPE
jgi:hypothetical protein